MQKHVNLVDRVKSFPTNILLQILASIQKRMSPLRFAHSAEKSEDGFQPRSGARRPCRDARPRCRSSRFPSAWGAGAPTSESSPGWQERRASMQACYLCENRISGRGNYVKIQQTLRGSFPAVSTPNVASKYWFESY